MFALDLFNNDHERRIAEGAVDQLEQRRIDDLAMKMDDLVARAKTATTAEVKQALMKEFQKCKAERDSYYMVRNETMGYGGLTGESQVTPTATGIRHYAKPGNYGGYEPEADPLARLDKHAVNRADNAMGIKWNREKKYQGGLDVDEAGIPGNVPVEKIPGKEDLLKGKGRSYYEASQKKNSEVTEEQRLAVGDPVVVTAPNEFEGKTGEIHELSPSGKFVIVDLYNHGKHSMHLSDVEYNQYADQEETDDWYDDADEFGMPGSEFFPEGYASTIGINPPALDPVSQWKINVRQLIADYIKDPQALYRMAKQKGANSAEAMAYKFIMHPKGKIDLPPDAVTFEGYQDFDKVEPYEVCIAGKPIKNGQHDYYEEARRHRDNLKNKWRKQGRSEKEIDTITINPVMKEQGVTEGKPITSTPNAIANAKKLWQYVGRNLDDLASNADFDAERNELYIDNKLNNLFTTANGQAVKVAFDMGSSIEFDKGILYIPIGTMWKYRGWYTSEKFVNEVVQALGEQDVAEAGSPAQQAAIAIAIKKAGKKPKQMDEDTGSWIVYDPETKQIKKRFKTHTAGKSYARTHGLGFASSEFYFDRVKDNKEVAETALNPQDPRGDYAAKRRALQDLGMNKDVDQAAVLQRRLDLDREAKAKGVTEVAPPGAKAERMVKHIKKAYSKDGKLTPKEKAIAYATTWKAHNDGKVEEGAMSNLHAELSDVYNRMAPGIERNRDSFKAGQLYDALEAVAEQHGAETEFKRMMSGARNRAHMDYDTNPGGFQNWFWYLPFDQEELSEEQDTSGVERAILNRIMVAHTDLLMKFGPDKVMQAAEEVAYNVGDVDEIGTSDVSAYVNQVKKILGVPEELDEKWSQKYKSSINCANPKGFSQKAHCAGKKK